MADKTLQEQFDGISALIEPGNYRVTFKLAGPPAEPGTVQLNVIGPEGGVHFAGEYTYRELMDNALAMTAAAYVTAGWLGTSNVVLAEKES